MKKMIEVTCCDGCGKQFGKDAEMQPHFTELYIGGTATHTVRKVKVMLTVDDRLAELCVKCLSDLCMSLEIANFKGKASV